MKASELRIGNWIYDLSLSPTKVVGTGTNCIWISEVGPGIDSAFSPIPLTEEWLVKFGFDHKYYGWDKGTFEIARHKDGYIYSINSNEYTDGRPFKYVHQLQNLYFALTGEELTIKE